LLIIIVRHCGLAHPPAPFVHPGLGNSLGFVDPACRLAMGYVMNRMVIGLDARYADLCKALYACL
jgi:CubicO group peptidase (beta-lactamase class C family)